MTRTANYGSDHVNSEMKEKRSVSPSACGIVVEYNPLHTGHIHHIQESRRISRCDVLIAVMSPHFVQRGDIAIVSPYERAKAAITHGVDLVVELPYPYCSQHADKFSIGAIKVLNQLDIEYLCFGSESNNIDTIARAKLQVEKDIFMNKQMTDSFSLGNPSSEKGNNQLYNPKTTSLASRNQNDHSNDILGIAYLKALQDTNITPLTIQRTNNYRSEDITTIHASATALRKAFHANGHDKSIAQFTPLYDTMKQEALPALSQHYDQIKYLLCTASTDYLKTMFLMEEGIEQLFIKQAQRHDSFDDFVQACISKRYTKARITRTLTHLLLQTTKKRAQQLEDLSFVRVLAMNENGQHYLKALKKQRKEQNEENKIINQPAIAWTIASRFNQLPKLYQQEIMKHLYLIYSKTSTEQLKQAIRQELEYPLLVKGSIDHDK